MNRPEIERDAPLDRLSTFRLPARARELARLTDPDRLPELLDTGLPVLLLGGGSNTLFTADFPGRIIVNELTGIESELIDHDRVRLTVAAGEDWHGLVRWSLDRGLWGLENLALIPGKVGAAPMQNIGAYGVELAHCLEAVEVFDRQNGTRRRLDAAECDLGYRSSRFKDTEPDRFVILGIDLIVQREGTPVLDYPTLTAELKSHGIRHPDARQVAAAVMRIRKHKLPDPGRIASAGSFFKNPIVPLAKARELLDDYPDLPHWPDSPGRVKLSAAWMIDQLGWRGKSEGDAAVYENHALVLVNRGRASAEQILTLARRIHRDVDSRYGVQLVPEPVLVGVDEFA